MICKHLCQSIEAKKWMYVKFVLNQNQRVCNIGASESPSGNSFEKKIIHHLIPTNANSDQKSVDAKYIYLKEM